jgi:hypothetical protein
MSLILAVNETEALEDDVMAFLRARLTAALVNRLSPEPTIPSLRRRGVIAQGDCAFATLLCGVDAEFAVLDTYQEQASYCKRYRESVFTNIFSRALFNQVETARVDRGQPPGDCEYATLLEIGRLPATQVTAQHFWDVLAAHYQCNILLIVRNEPPRIPGQQPSAALGYFLEMFVGVSQTWDACPKRWMLAFLLRGHFEPIVNSRNECVFSLEDSENSWLEHLTRHLFRGMAVMSSVSDMPQASVASGVRISCGSLVRTVFSRASSFQLRHMLRFCQGFALSPITVH